MARRPLEIRILQWVALLLVAIVVVGFGLHTTGWRRFADGVAAFERAGGQVGVAEYNLPPVPEEENAAPLLDRLARLVEEGEARFEVPWNVEPSEDEELRAALQRWGQRAGEEDPEYRHAIEASVEALGRGVGTDDEWQLVRSWRTELDAEFRSIDAIFARPRWWFDVQAPGAENVNTARLKALEQAVPWILVDARSMLRDGRPAEALEQWRKAWHLALSMYHRSSSMTAMLFVLEAGRCLSTLELLLQELPAGTDVSAVVTALDSIDVYAWTLRVAKFQQSYYVEQYDLGNTLFLREQVGHDLPLGIDPIPWNEGFDALEFLEISNEYVEALSVSLQHGLEAIEEQEPRRTHPRPRAPLAAEIASYVVLHVEDCAALANQRSTARTHLTDYQANHEQTPAPANE